MKIRINTEAKFRWKLLMEGEEVDWAYYDLIVEITKPSHSKEIIDMTIDGSTLVFSYKPNQCGQYIATAYLNRYKPDEAALDVKIFEGVRWSWCADNDDDEITTFNLSGNISYSSVNLNNYYTKQEIDDKLEDIVVGDVDLTDYATKTWVGNKYQPKGDYQPTGNYLTSIPSEYVTETELETRLGKIDIPTPDLSDYATKAWTTANYQPKGDYQPAGNYLTSIPSEYVTETELETRLENISSDDEIPVLWVYSDDGSYNDRFLVQTIFDRMMRHKPCIIEVHERPSLDNNLAAKHWGSINNWEFKSVLRDGDTLMLWIDGPDDTWFEVSLFNYAHEDDTKYHKAGITKRNNSIVTIKDTIETEVVKSTVVRNIVTITQANYDSTIHMNDTLYIIVD